jgi:hypothetical protein
MHAPLVVGTIVSAVVLFTGMITAFALQTSEYRLAPHAAASVDPAELTRNAGDLPLQHSADPI